MLLLCYERMQNFSWCLKLDSHFCSSFLNNSSMRLKVDERMIIKLNIIDSIPIVNTSPLNVDKDNYLISSDTRPTNDVQFNSKSDFSDWVTD